MVKKLLRLFRKPHFQTFTTKGGMSGLICNEERD